MLAGEPQGPVVKTEIPGPRSKELLAELSSIQVCTVQRREVRRRSCPARRPPGSHARGPAAPQPRSDS